MPEREKRVRRRAAILAVLTVAAFTTACAGAQAKTVRLGSPLTGSFEQFEFVGCAGCWPYGQVPFTETWVQTQLPEPGAYVRSPVDGTVISYRVVATDGTFAIQVVRRSEGPSPYGQSIASSAPSTITSSGVSPPIAANLALKRGDSVGIRNFHGTGGLGAFHDSLGEKILTWASVGIWYPPLVDGAQTLPGSGSAVCRGLGCPPGFEIGMQATVRYCKVPDLQGKTPKAARKALTGADCTVGKLTTKKVAKKKQVLAQSVKPGTAISDTQPINLKVSRGQG